MTDDLPMKEYRRAGLEITRGNPGRLQVPLVAA